MTVPSCTLSSELHKVIASHVEAEYPHEACGLLLGRRVGRPMLISQVVASPNIAEEPSRRFEIDPSLRLRLQKAARAGGDVILGHYHSHPDGAARPSDTDRAGIFEADLIWLIVAVKYGRMESLAAFMPWPKGGGFTALELNERLNMEPNE